MAGRGGGDGTTPVLELRQYTLHPGARETLIEVFEDHFIEGQEACGMRVIGQFRDLDDPDRFVWLREFDGMDARARALEAFYTGPVWTAQADRANATMIDWRDVLLLKPANARSGFAFDATQRAGLRAAAQSEPEPSARNAPALPALADDILVVTIYALDVRDALDARDTFGAIDTTEARDARDARDERHERDERDELETRGGRETAQPSAFADWFRETAVPLLAQAGISVLAQLLTESAPNSFPRLPVREGEQVFAWLAAYPDRASHAAAVRALDAQEAWREDALPALRAMTRGEPVKLALSPTRRSWLRYRAAAHTVDSADAARTA
jgi:hypothetical protein